MRDAPERIALSIAEAAFVTNLGRDHLYAAIREGRLEAKKIGRRTLITLDDLNRFLIELPSLRLRSSDRGRS